jgi:creatinine amidohydrolase
MPTLPSKHQGAKAAMPFGTLCPFAPVGIHIGGSAGDESFKEQPMKRWSYAPLALALLLSVGYAPAFAQQPGQPAAAGGGGRAGGAGRGGGAGGGAPRVEVVRPAGQRVPGAFGPDMIRPVALPDNLWMSELTILEMRDLVKTYGYTTALIMNGTMESNGPYLTTGKHNHVLKVTGEAIARTLGKTLLAPIVMLDSGNPETTTQPGRLVLSKATLHNVLTDMATSLKSQGFKEIIFIGDSGSNQTMLATVATELTEKWKGQDVRAMHIREYYNYGDVLRYQNEVLLPQLTAAKRIEENKDLDGYHDDYYISSLIMNDSPRHVRYEERAKVNLTHINSVPLVLEEALAVGKALAQFRADVTVAAINRIRSGQTATNATAAPRP